MTTSLEVISAIGSFISGIGTVLGILIAYLVHKNQKLLTQRQLLIPLWEHISNISDIDPKNPITPDIISAVNKLELVALCCEGGMIDERIIMRTFKDQFMKHYENISRCQEIPNLNCDGDKLLKENKATIQFYKKLVNQYEASDRLTKA